MEWYCRTYRETLERVLAMPAVHIALFYRIWSQSVAGLKTSTLAEEIRDRYYVKILKQLVEKQNGGQRNSTGHQG